MIQIQLQPEIEAQLSAEAQARGMALDRYITKIVEERPLRFARQDSVGAAIDRIKELRQGNLANGIKLKDLVHEGHKY